MEQLMIHWMNNQIFVRAFLLKQIINYQILVKILLRIHIRDFC